jgi:ketosteroid isomerase-like protein
MTSEESKAVVQAYLDASAQGRTDDVRAMLTPDARFWASAAPPRYGQVLTVDQYWALSGIFAQNLASRPEVTWSPMTAEGDKVYVQAEVSCQLKNGRTYNNHYVFYFQVRDAKIAVLKEYHDTLHFVDCFQGTEFFDAATKFLGSDAQRSTNLFDLESPPA